ncbi:MAG: carboxypeptidase regulatory-like domain-containing protein [Planctomycetes bacterium]|nr:carboxypeptidase regulatory-like domain-containing protein [Planctomycetota bacterium]
MKYDFELEKAILALNNTPIVEGPSDELIKRTLMRIAETELLAKIEHYGTFKKLRYSNFAKFAAAAVIICIGTLALLTFTDRFEFNTSGTVQTKNTTDTGANQTVTDISKMGIKEKIELAGELLSQNKIASLIALLNDPDLNVRLTAYKALKNSNDPQAIAAVSAFAAQLEELSNQTPDLQQITPAAEPNESELINAPADTQGNLLFKTVDQLTGMLLGNVKLDIKWEGKEQYNDVTNSEGVCNIDFEGQRPGDIRIVASLPGFVPKTFYYTKYYDKAFIIPKSHTMTLERGTSISGRIVNQQQEPISGASVFVTIQTDIAQQRISEYNFVNDHKVLTDTNGFWSCDVIPDNADKVNLRLSHPDYIDDEYSGRTISTSTPIENLRSGNIVSVMKKGIPVTGIVVDRQGNPIKSATINKGEYTSDAYKCRTNPQGQFNLGHVKPGLALITVSAKGFAPQLEELDINQDTEPLVFTLEPAQSIYGQMVDQDDKPISGVWINVDSWRGYRTLDNGSYRTRTGKDGNFELKNMPNEEMLFSIYKPGYLSINKLPMSCDTAKYTIVLYPPVNAKGSVTDADTNEPIKQFTLTEGILWQGQENVSWQTHSSRIKTMQGPDYNYDFTSGGADGFTIRIAADGYLPQDSNIFYIDQQNIVCDFKLKKADNIQGKRI